MSIRPRITTLELVRQRGECTRFVDQNASMTDRSVGHRTSLDVRRRRSGRQHMTNAFPRLYRARLIRVDHLFSRRLSVESVSAYACIVMRLIVISAAPAAAARAQSAMNRQLDHPQHPKSKSSPTTFRIPARKVFNR